MIRTSAGLPERLLQEARLGARYFSASLAATLLDVALFQLWVGQGAAAGVAAAIGYASGLLLHYLLSRWAFASARRGTAQLRELAGFVSTGVFGLVLTSAGVQALVALGLPPLFAKLVIIPVNFCTLYLLRRRLVFQRA